MTGLTTEQVDSDVKIIQEWLTNQPHLPKTIDDQFVRRFLYSCHHRIDQTKRTIDLCYSMRNNAPEIFSERDPLSAQVQQVFSATDMIPLPKTTSENYKVFIYRLADQNPEAFFFNACVKTFLMVADVRLVSEKEFPAGEVPIFDMAGVTYRHLTRIVLPTLKKYMSYTQEAHPIRLKQIHIINCSAFMDVIMSIVKPLMKNQVFAMMHFHLPNSDTLNKFVPKELLPVDYGGSAPSIMELKKEWIQKIVDHREYFLNEDNWKINESKRPKPYNGLKAPLPQKQCLQGSFRTLSID